jgi:hypothetical protein
VGASGGITVAMGSEISKMGRIDIRHQGEIIICVEWIAVLPANSTLFSPSSALIYLSFWEVTFCAFGSEKGGQS